MLSEGWNRRSRFKADLCSDGLGGALVLDDSYNASSNHFVPRLRCWRFSGRQILIAGDMKELGSESRRAHQSVGEMAKRAGVGSLWAVGDTQVWLWNPLEGGVVFEDQQSLVEYASKQLDADSVVLVKGSRGSRMECVVNDLRRGEEA